MWILLNDAMFSIVEDRQDRTRVVVRARFEGDLEKVFPAYAENVIVQDISDYRFRIFADRDYVKEIVASEVERIDYDNFKNSVADDERHNLYTKVWQIFFSAQESRYPRKNAKWWLNYRDHV